MNNSSVLNIEDNGETCGVSNLDYFNHYFSTIASIILNLLLLYSIEVRTKTELNDYTILLKVNSCADLFNAFYSCILFIYEDESSGSPVYVFNGVFKYVLVYLPNNIKHWLLAGCMGLLLSAVNICAVPFIYRYFILLRQYVIPSKVLALIYFVSFIPNLAGVILYVVLIDKYGYIIVNLVHNQSSPCLIDEEWTTSYSAFSITDPYDLFLNRLVSLPIYMCLTSYIPIFFCGIRIIHYLQVNRALLIDPKIQSDINLTLVVQTIIPFVLCAAPIYFGVIWKGPKFKVISFRFIFKFVIWIPFFNALAAFYFIRPYREFILDLMSLITHPGSQRHSSVQFLASGQQGQATATINQ